MLALCQFHGWDLVGNESLLCLILYSMVYILYPYPIYYIHYTPIQHYDLSDQSQSSPESIPYAVTGIFKITGVQKGRVESLLTFYYYII